MAIGAGTVFQVQSTATAGNVNGGGFNPGNANGITDGVIAGGTGNTPTLSSVTYAFTNADNNHWIYFPAQANITAGWYQITSQSGGVATLSAAIGAAQIVTNNMFGTNTVAGCATTAAPTGVTYLVDYSQSDTARYSNSVLTGTTTSCTDATNPFTAQMVGNFMCIASGTGITAGWYEIVSVAAGTATISSSAGASYSLGVIKIGGAVSLGGSTTGITDTIFFGLAQTSATAAGRYFIKGGSSITYTVGQSIAAGTAGTSTWPTLIESYATTRGDRPMGATRPTIALGSNTWATATIWNVWGLQFTGTAATMCAPGSANTYYYCKFKNTSATASRIACSANSGTADLFIGCEFISYNGFGFQNQAATCFDCYFHDSVDGSRHNTSGGSYFNCIFASNTANAVNLNAQLQTTGYYFGNTFYGAENKTGKGINFITGTKYVGVVNNIFYGFTTAVTHADTNTTGFDDYNCYFNNTNDVSAAGQWQKGSHDIAVNPSFANVGQAKGTTATTTAGNHLVDSSASFITAGVTAGQDYLYVVSGTGVTAGVYGIASIDSATQITTDVAITANATGDKVYQITTGRNWSVGTNVKALGLPGLFPGTTTTTSYQDIGAVQRKEPNIASVLGSTIIQGYGAE